MSKQLLQPYKGARDFYPEDKRLQKWMFDKWRRVIERYGYEEYDAPILEPTELYLMKGSEEIVREQTYTFTDRGDRSVTIRTEMTPTVSRMVAGRRQELVYPARWYSIPNLWRYERMQRGRLREFWQLNVDIFGVDSLYAELEMIQIIDDLFQAFKAKRESYEIRVNSRRLVNRLFIETCGLGDDQILDAVRLIDRMKKMEPDSFLESLNSITKDTAATKSIIDFLSSDNVEDMPAILQESSSYKELQAVLVQAKQLGITNITYDPTLMRGFDYYTDIVFEVFDTDPENNRSMFGGGRYDGLVGEFGVDPIPTVGFGMGDVTFMNFLESHKLLPEMMLQKDVVIIIREGTDPEAIVKTAHELRDMGANVAVDYTLRKVDKQFKSAIKSGVRYVVFVGPEEVQSEQFVLKDLKTSKEETHGLQRIVSIIKDARKR